MPTDTSDDDGDLCHDKIGRCYCSKHRIEYCHDCCYDFRMSNRDREQAAGWSKRSTKLQQLVEQNVALEMGRRGFAEMDPAQFMRMQDMLND